MSQGAALAVSIHVHCSLKQPGRTMCLKEPYLDHVIHEHKKLDRHVTVINS